jgi:hypothetical protein
MESGHFEIEHDKLMTRQPQTRFFGNEKRWCLMLIRGNPFIQYSDDKYFFYVASEKDIEAKIELIVCRIGERDEKLIESDFIHFSASNFIQVFVLPFKGYPGYPGIKVHDSTLFKNKPKVLISCRVIDQRVPEPDPTPESMASSPFSVSCSCSSSSSSLTSVQTDQILGSDDSSLQQLFDFTSRGDPFSDFTIKVLDKESDQELDSIPVQKAILASASPVFRAMIYGVDMKEKRERVLILRGWSVTAVRGMVHFLFGIQVEDFPSIAHELFRMAHAFQIHRLQTVADSVLASALSEDSLLQALLLVGKYDVPLLKRRALEMVSENRGLLKDIDLDLLSVSLVKELLKSLLEPLQI